ncbi:MAG: hypothetical protein [Olavius algarvensis Gamma 1 endosymbiont]|nr:MAG: hypothetical protein [Olavius algarvensis Gamma 1 endosymbiont]
MLLYRGDRGLRVPLRRAWRAHHDLRGCLGTHFRNSLKIGRLDKINPLFLKGSFS